MREIKFRAWDISKKSYKYPKLWDNTMPSNWEQHYILEQFTGFTDTNGKEIYEGDIVEFDEYEWGGKNNIFIVSWDGHNGEWSFGGGSTSDMEFRTIIGNIYENPELLK